MVTLLDLECQRTQSAVLLVKMLGLSIDQWIVQRLISSAGDADEFLSVLQALPHHTQRMSVFQYTRGVYRASAWDRFGKRSEMSALISYFQSSINAELKIYIEFYRCTPFNGKAVYATISAVSGEPAELNVMRPMTDEDFILLSKYCDRLGITLPGDAVMDDDEVIQADIDEFIKCIGG
ncbi:MAG: hypothetical protein KatS3mg023_3670 [Armatimonadota bacterium]|nr:MAG: hypothetical protein KatS3mg023_3670 [Armatimonadota bacterium]